MKIIMGFIRFIIRFIIFILLMVVLVAASVLGGYHFYRIYICGDTEPKTTNVAESKNEDKKEDKEVDKKKDKDENKEKDKEKDKDENEKKNEEKDIKKSVKISAVGDCTIGWQDRFDPEKRFDAYLEKNDGNYGYYLEKVKDVFKNDDLTIVNLEGTFTKNLDKVEKEYNFSAPQEYTKVLTSGNVDIASFANNHTHDFGEVGYKDTIDALDKAKLPYYGYDKYLFKEVNGIKIGFFGLSDIDCKNYNDIDKALEEVKKENCDLIICSMHWGVEGDSKQCVAQTRMGHYLIDNGVDLILGSHPHRIQGIEKYNGHYIVYSMGNFCFGGNPNPRDKDTMIFQQTFTFEDGNLKLDDNIEIIPASISGNKSTNNYQPIVLEGKEKTNVLNRILGFSKGFIYKK